jgi:hypothetical protein
MHAKLTLDDGSLAATAPRRVGAKLVDTGGALWVSQYFFPFGWLLSFLYLALGDRWKNGTFGSRLFRIRVRPLAGAARLSRRAAFLRNLSSLTVVTLYQVPLWGIWIAGFAIAGLAIVNGYLIWGCGVHDGLGNLMGGARVVDA